MGKNQGIEKPEGTGTWILIPTVLLMLFFLLPPTSNYKNPVKPVQEYSHTVVSGSANTTSFLVI